MDHLPDDIDPTMWEPDPTTGCWNWQGTLDRYKYVRYIDAYGEREHLHRVIARRKFGKIEKWQRVYWTCDNSHCINPDHITLANNPGARRKLTDEQIGKIKTRNRDSATDLAKEFGVSVHTIRSIRRGERHLLVDAKTEVTNGTHEKIPLRRNSR